MIGVTARREKLRGKLKESRINKYAATVQLIDFWNFIAIFLHVLRSQWVSFFFMSSGKPSCRWIEIGVYFTPGSLSSLVEDRMALHRADLRTILASNKWSNIFIISYG